MAVRALGQRRHACTRLGGPRRCAGRGLSRSTDPAAIASPPVAPRGAEAAKTARPPCPGMAGCPAWAEMVCYHCLRKRSGLGYDPQILDAIEIETRQMTLGEKVAEVQALGVHGGDRKSEGFQGSNHYLEKGERGSGYRSARLPRRSDHGDCTMIRISSKRSRQKHAP